MSTLSQATRGQSLGGKTAYVVKNVDKFGAEYQMGLDKYGTRTLVTWVGSIFSLFYMALLATYSMQKFNIAATKTGGTIMQTVKDDYFDEKESFTFQNGFSIAFGLINDEFNLEPLTPDIGYLELYAFEWGFDENDEHFYR